MGCHGSKEQSELQSDSEQSESEQSESSLEGGRACEVAAPDPVMLLVKRVIHAARRAALQAASDAAGPAPVILTKEQQAAKRAAQLKRLAALPEHLRLGITLPGMRKLLAELPPDALEQVNLHNAKYPPNDSENGYCNQFFITKWAKEAKEGQPEGDRLAVCERLQKQGSPHVGEATVFVSWYLNTTITTLLDALANFLEQQGLREEDTFFWVCDYVIRQTNVGPDLALLGDCVSALGHTVLLMEPWHAPKPLKRAYCIKEVYHTQVSE